MGQVGWEWLAVEALESLPFYPKVLASRLQSSPEDGDFAYLGDSV